MNGPSFVERTSGRSPGSDSLPADVARPKHSPGPWKVVTPISRTHIKTLDDHYVLEAHFGARNIHDAHLIAAAPDLLAALKGLLPQTSTGNPTRAQEVAHWEYERDQGNGYAPFVLAAYAAIAKASA